MFPGTCPRFWMVGRLTHFWIFFIFFELAKYWILQLSVCLSACHSEQFCLNLSKNGRRTNEKNGVVGRGKQSVGSIETQFFLSIPNENQFQRKSSFIDNFFVNWWKSETILQFKLFNIKKFLWHLFEQSSCSRMWQAAWCLDSWSTILQLFGYPSWWWWTHTIEQTKNINWSANQVIIPEINNLVPKYK